MAAEATTTRPRVARARAPCHPAAALHPILFHIGGYETLDALHFIIPGLRDRGFTLTSLSDLLN